MEFTEKKADPIYVALVPVLREEGDHVVIGGNTSDSDPTGKFSWGEQVEGGPRDIADTEFKVDKHYWHLLGKPESVVIAFTTEAGWEAFDKAGNVA